MQEKVKVQDADDGMNEHEIDPMTGYPIASVDNEARQ